MVKQTTELMYAVRFRVVFKCFGQLCLVLAVLTLVPLGVSILFGGTALYRGSFLSHQYMLIGFFLLVLIGDGRWNISINVNSERLKIKPT